MSWLVHQPVCTGQLAMSESSGRLNLGVSPGLSPNCQQVCTVIGENVSQRDR